MIGVGLGAHPITLYNTCYNNFNRLDFNNQATINGRFLQLDNTSTSDIIVTDSTYIDSSDDFKYYIKFANLHNKEGKSYKSLMTKKIAPQFVQLSVASSLISMLVPIGLSL